MRTLFMLVAIIGIIIGSMSEIIADDRETAISKMDTFLHHIQHGNYELIGDVHLLQPLGGKGELQYYGYFLRTKPDSTIYCVSFCRKAWFVREIGHNKPSVKLMKAIVDQFDSSFAIKKVEEMSGQHVIHMQLAYCDPDGALIDCQDIENPLWQVFLRDGSERYFYFSSDWRLMKADSLRKTFFEH